MAGSIYPVMLPYKIDF